MMKTLPTQSNSRYRRFKVPSLDFGCLSQFSCLVDPFQTCQHIQLDMKQWIVHQLIPFHRDSKVNKLKARL